VWQTSILPEIPRALFEMTHVSRGRLVNRITLSCGYASATTAEAESPLSAQVIKMWFSVSTSNKGMIYSFPASHGERRRHRNLSAITRCVKANKHQ
jgi:hypothetical protein